jgi:hypothetical protein
MRIEYWGALVRAWRRMSSLLFRPFDPAKWLVIAFCAWVAGLLDGSSGGGGGGDHGGVRLKRIDADSAAEALRQILAAIRGAWEWVIGHWGATLLVFVGIPLLIAVILLLVWVTSRFKLIYLDNLVRGRAEVAEPWRRLGALGDSLFLFRVAFGLSAVAVGGALVAMLVSLGVFSLTSGAKGLGIVGIAVAGLLLVALVVGAIYLKLFLDSFVVPIMWRHNLPAIPAWRVFLPWLSAEGGSFLLYGLFVLLLFILAAAAILVFGLATCCIGWLLLMLPFVGTVLLLPFLVTYRYLSLEFLAQFDPALSVFPPTASTTAGAEQEG